MKAPPFRYERPANLDDALALLATGGTEAKILAGGQSLVPLLNLRLVRPTLVIDINRIDGLSGRRADDTQVCVGALVRARDVETWTEARRCPMLVEALRWIGHVEIRNRSTVCGSLAHADPVAELPLAAVALEATLVARSGRGERTIPAAEFFLGPLTTALAPDEILVEARFPALCSGAGWAFLEVARRRGDFALAAVAAVIEPGPDGRLGAVRLALGGVDDTPVRARAAEAVLLGARPGREVFREAAQEATRHLTPPGDVHASGPYRRTLAVVLAERALALAADRCREACA